MVDVRPATFDDARFVWECRNDPESRASSGRMEEIPYESHEKWFAGAINDSWLIFLIGVDAQNGPCGYVRFNINIDEATVSVAVDPKRRGEGIGTAMLKAGMRHLWSNRPGVMRVKAEVKPENVASLKSFSRCGYTQTLYSHRPA